jgi:EAL domain-containing protein (putative c-di-GMP-specific phosphodiesterase class I)
VAGQGATLNHNGHDLEAVMQSGLSAVYQPIVDLPGGRPVAYEALARGPRGSALESPGALFGAAREQGRTADLDRACCRAALRGAIAGGLRRPTGLFVNIEPEVAGADSGSATSELLDGAHTQLDVFFEVTERALTHDPARLLEAVERLREAGIGVALDDVGADQRSLALLPLLRPDVVKLDMSLIHSHPSRRSGEIMNGVCAYAESTGAAILAEGVETERHLMSAQSMGATLAQGWYFGRPGPLGAEVHEAHPPVRLGVPPRALPRSPVRLAHARRQPTIGRKDVLLSITRALEAQAHDLGGHAVIAATFQHRKHFTQQNRIRYEVLAQELALTVVLGTGIPEDPAPGLYGGPLAPDDPLVGEWDVAVLGPHYAGALVARDLGDEGPDRERRFEFVVTFDRDLVVDIAACLIARLSGGRQDSSERAVAALA